MTDTLAFLLSDVSRLLRRRFDERARAVGATRAQWKALMVTARQEGINQGRLADLLEVEPITLCRMVDRLQESGLLERRRDPADRRAWQLFLTERSRPLIGELRAVADEVTGQALAGLSDDSLAQLTDVLGRIRHNLAEEPMVKEAAHG